MNFQSSFLTTEQINLEVEIFFHQYNPAMSIPVPIEEIIDIKLQMDIIPIPGLKDSFIKAGLDIDAFISSDFKSITVDKFMYNPNKTNVRYQFSLAHEIGHMVLHKHLFNELKFNNCDDWIRMINELPQKELKRVEWQASEFAGLLLVPRKILKNVFRKAIKDTEKLLDSKYEKRKDFILETAIECYIAPKFNVAKYTAKIRIERDGLA